MMIHSTDIAGEMPQECTYFYRTCEPPNPVLVLIEPRFEEPSPRLSSNLELDPQRDPDDGCG